MGFPDKAGEEKLFHVWTNDAFGEKCVSASNCAQAERDRRQYYILAEQYLEHEFTVAKRRINSFAGYWPRAFGLVGDREIARLKFTVEAADHDFDYTLSDRLIDDLMCDINLDVFLNVIRAILLNKDDIDFRHKRIGSKLYLIVSTETLNSTLDLSTERWTPNELIASIEAYVLGKGENCSLIASTSDIQFSPLDGDGHVTNITKEIIEAIVQRHFAVLIHIFGQEKTGVLEDLTIRKLTLQYF